MKSDKYWLPVLLVGFALLVGLVYLPLMEAVAYAIVFAYLSRPIVRKIRPVLGDIAAPLLTLLVLVSVITLLILYTGVQVLAELNKLSVDSWMSSVITASKYLSTFISNHPEVSPFISSLSNQLNTYISMASTKLFEFVFQLVNLIVTLVMALVIAFFLLKDGKMLRKFLEELLPRRISKQIDRIDANIEGIFVGSIFSAFTVGMITTVVFEIASIPYAFISGFIAALLQFIPMVGPQLFLIPATAYYLLLGDFPHAVILFLLAVFLFFVPDNVIKPILLSRTTDIHPLLVLLAFIGGVLVFGPKGFVIGPVLLAIFDGLIHAWLG